MLFLGILGIIQVTWLPGFILLKLSRIKTGRIGNLVFGFALSLTFNYVLVLILTTLKVFVQWLLIVLLILEVLAAIWLSRRFLLGKLGDSLRGFWAETIERLTTYFVSLKNDLAKREKDAFYRKMLFGLLFLLALVPLWWVIRIFLDNLGTVFNSWDTLVSWNPWATQWAANAIPLHTMRYPQLIPTNWAFIYVLTGNASVQFFTKAIMPLFLLSILLLMVVLGVRQRNAGFFLGGVIAYFVIKHFLGEYIPEGYVDIPVAFMSFAAIATLFWARQTEGKDSIRIMLLGAILAGGAAVTKQTGLYILAAYPVLAYLLVIRKREGFNTARTIKFILLLLFVSFIIAAPWYVYKEITFLQGMDGSETALINGHMSNLLGNASIPQQLLNGLLQIGKYLALYAVLLISLLLIEKGYRWLVVIIVLPFTILWAFFLSYDIRNLAIAMPFLSILSGIGLVAMLDWVYRKALRPLAEKIPLAVILVLMVMVPVTATVVVKNETIINSQMALQKQIFSKSLDAQLYSIFADQDLSKIKFLTNYPVDFLPGFEQSQVNFFYNDLVVFQAEVQDPSINYLLVPVYAIADIQNAIQTMLQSGRLKFILEDHSWIGYTLYQIVR